LKKHPIKTSLLILCIFLLLGYEMWIHFSPIPTSGWNIVNLKRINVSDRNHFSFAVFGDNRGSKYAFENLLKLIDHDQDITFGIDLGNMVSSGKVQRYDYLLKQVKNNLALPLLTAIGNHELYGKGRELYCEIFGPAYYSFQVGKNYFMVLDDADGKGLGREQRLWLEKELEKSLKYKTRIIFMHVPLNDPRGTSYHHCLAEESADDLINLFLRYRVTHVFASHIHGHFEGNLKGIPYTITGWSGLSLAGDRPDHSFFHFLKVRIKNGGVDVSVRNVLSPAYEKAGLLSYMASVYICDFLKFYGIETVLLLIAGGLVLTIYRSESRRRYPAV